MGLRGVKATEVPQRMKAFFYGAAGVGKSTAGIQFPKPYWIDTEGSSDKKIYRKLLEKSGGVVFQTVDFDEMIKEIKELLSIKHEYKTLVIDSLTIVYNDLIEKAEKKVGTKFGRQYLEANKQMKHLMNLLLRLDMNVIITSHSKDKFGNEMAVIGQTFDCYKKIDYLFDLVFEVQKRGDQRVAITRKTRLEEFPDNETFNFCYEEFEKRGGKEMFEKEAKVEKLASREQVQHLRYLIDLYKEKEETIDKWLAKAKVDSFDEMNEDMIQKIIDHLESRSKPKNIAKEWESLNK